ncbi:ROK family protein [Nocardia sp. CA-084685]|uniref:ROK family protein n=1 Tax=Nocardia sp. CA-084685 TaxID=3239970 RepID=UPI003D959853
MTMLALEIGPGGFAVSRVADNVGEDEIRRVSIPARAAWDSCRDLLLEAAGGEDVTRVGIGSVGPLDMAAGVVAPPGIAEWGTGFGIVAAVQRLFPNAIVQLALDGVCLGLAERNFGAMNDVLDALAVMVSDRIGAGVMVGGFVVVGRTGNAGNLGHVLVPGFDELCECGGRGCLEAVAGGVSAVKWARAQGWQGTSVDDLVGQASAGDELADAALTRAGTALGRAIASVAALLDLDLVVLGGTLAAPGTSLWKALGAAVATHARLGYLTGLRVVPSELGAVGVLAGAGVLALTAGEG